MKSTVTLLLLVIALYSCKQAGSGKFIAAGNRHIAYVGRFDLSDRKAPVFMYSGSVIRTIFSGTSVGMIMKDDSLRNMFDIIIDDSLYVLPTNRPDGIYPLAANLKDTKHKLEIYRRTEWHAGNTTFLGLNLDKGKKLYRPDVKERMIEFIGDSYTCGYGNEGKSRDEHFTYETENNYLTFGSLAARALGAEYTGICRSGIGMFQGYGGDPDFTMPKLYDEVIVNGKKPWDFSKSPPQAVVIDLGGNDLSAPLDSASFADAYTGFLKRIRNNYRSARIVCIAGPDNSGFQWDTWRSYMHAIVNKISDSDPLVSYFEFTPFEPNGSDWHPNIVEHCRMSEELIPYLRNLMKW